MKFTEIILIYISFISLISVIFTIHDKRAAKSHRQRIPERTLMLLGLAGGSVAMLITMCIIRHKTKHLKFMLGLPLEIILHIAMATAVVFLVK